MLSLQRHEHRLPQAVEVVLKAPDLDSRDHREVLRGHQQVAVAIGRIEQLDVSDLAGRGRGHVGAADLRQLVHEDLGLLERLGALLLVIDHPAEEGDGAGDREALIGELLLQVGKLAA